MRTELLLELLEREGLENCYVNSNTSVWSEWLNDNDNRAEPITVNGMLNRLGLSSLSEVLRESESLGLCNICIDDRALIVEVNLN